MSRIPLNRFIRLFSESHRVRRIIIFLFIAINLLVTGEAQHKHIKFKQLTIEDGLSQSSVYCILQDKKGFMWFGTEDGLNKYDGYDFEIFKNEPKDTNSLSYNYVKSMVEDKEGNLWIGTYGGGLNKFNPETEQFTRYRSDPSDANRLINDYINSLCLSQNGILWIGTDEGLTKFDPEKERFTSFTSEPGAPGSLSDNKVMCVLEDHTGTIWVGTAGGGLNRYDKEKDRFSHYLHNPSNKESISSDFIRCILEDKSGTLWIGTEGGLNRFDRRKERFIRYKADPPNPQSLSNNFVYTLYEDSDAILWVGTLNGLNKFDKEKGNFIHFYSDPSDPHNLSYNEVFSIKEDRSGVLWIGTHVGLNKLNKERKPFFHYQIKAEGSDSLTNNFVRCLYKEESGVIWVGTYGGLNKLNLEKNKYTHFTSNPDNPQSLSDNRVMDICKEDKGVYWIATFGGLEKFYSKREKFFHYKHNPNQPYSLSSNLVRCLFKDHLNDLWVGTENGLNKFDREKERFIRYNANPDKPGSLSNNFIYTVYEDRKGTLWVGTLNGLNKFNRESKEFISYKADPLDPNSLSSSEILSIYEDRSGALWLGTPAGLNKFNREKESFSYYTTNDGLPNDLIYDILEDNKGHLWLSTNKGLSRFNPETEEFKNYDVKDGLQSNEFNLGACFQAKDGEMFFGGINGFNSFYPHKIKANPHVPPVVITDFQIYNKSILPGKEYNGSLILRNSISETDKIKLSYRDEVISFEFAALHYASPEKNNYAYMMEGFEKEWNYVGHRRFATYTNLPPGNYTFRVKGSNNDGLWNEKGESVNITITPPFWQTWWFRGGVIITLILLLIVGYNIRTHNIRERATQLKRIVESRTTELKDANKGLRKEINERKKAQKNLKRRAAQAALLYKAGQRISSELKLETLFSEIVSTICKEFDYYAVSLMLVDEEGKRLQLRSIAGGYADIFPQDLSYALGEGMTGYAALTGETQVSGDVSKNPHYIRETEELTKSELSVPIRGRQKVIGVLDIQSKEYNAFDEADVTAMETLSSHISAAIENAWLYKNAQKEIFVRKQIEEKLNESLKEKEVMLKEIHHRVKNNMQIISSLLRLQSDQIENKKMQEMFKVSQNRIRSMALIHEKLYQSSDLAKIDFSDYIRSLTANLFSIYKAKKKDIYLNVELEEVYLNINTAIPLALVVNEVVSNSLKHAFPQTWSEQKRGKSRNQINLSLKKSEKKQVMMTISDNGVGLPKNLDLNKIRSLGLQLINDLVEQVNGSLNLQTEQGTTFRIKFRV